MSRSDGRKSDELRSFEFIVDYTENADGSVLVRFGKTKVLVTAMINNKVPPFLEGKNQGWITAEYSLLPGSTIPRSQREVNRGKPSGRTSEIQRLIGRSLRAAFDLNKIGERTIHIDADVINADASTRCASICGAYVAVHRALSKLKVKGDISNIPVIRPVAAVSVGVVKGNLLLDLNYVEDSSADVDSNIIMDESGDIIELQITSEKEPFDRTKVGDLVDLAQKGIKEIITKQKEVCR